MAWSDSPSPASARRWQDCGSDSRTDVVLIDGSRVEAIAHKLKILRDERAVVLPGCLLAVYDLFRGIPRILEFSVDAAAGELTRAKEALARIKRDTLIVGDRLYAMGAFFEGNSSGGYAVALSCLSV